MAPQDDSSREFFRSLFRPALADLKVGATIKTASDCIDTPPHPMLQKCKGHLRVCPSAMVGVAQLVERQTVDLDVAGSNPVTHPMLSNSLATLYVAATRWAKLSMS